MQEFEEKESEIQKTEESIKQTPEPESICISNPMPSKKQHADDVALTQCILCVLLVLIMFALHWLKPDWQEMLLTQYTKYRDNPPLEWLDQLLQAIQQWIAG